MNVVDYWAEEVDMCLTSYMENEEEYILNELNDKTKKEIVEDLLNDNDMWLTIIQTIEHYLISYGVVEEREDN